MKAKDVIDTLTNGLQMSEEDKAPLLLAYQVGLMKVMLEAEIGLRIKNKQSIEPVSQFFNQEYQALTPDDRTEMDLLLQKESGNIIEQVMSGLIKALPKESADAVVINIKKYVASNPISSREILSDLTK